MMRGRRRLGNRRRRCPGRRAATAEKRGGPPKRAAKRQSGRISGARRMTRPGWPQSSLGHSDRDWGRRGHQPRGNSCDTHSPGRSFYNADPGTRFHASGSSGGRPEDRASGQVSPMLRGRPDPPPLAGLRAVRWRCGGRSHGRKGARWRRRHRRPDVEERDGSLTGRAFDLRPPAAPIARRRPTGPRA